MTNFKKFNCILRGLNEIFIWENLIGNFKKSHVVMHGSFLYANEIEMEK